MYHMHHISRHAELIYRQERREFRIMMRIYVAMVDRRGKRRTHLWPRGGSAHCTEAGETQRARD